MTESLNVYCQYLSALNLSLSETLTELTDNKKKMKFKASPCGYDNMPILNQIVFLIKNRSASYCSLHS